jgi:hypothetical protein
MSREGQAIGEPPSQGSSPILLRSCPHSPLRRLQHCAEACSGSDHSRRPAIPNKILGMIHSHVPPRQPVSSSFK